MRIMLEKLYGTHSGSAVQMCSVQFLEHDPHIFALFLNVLKYKYNSSLSPFLPFSDKRQHITYYK